MIEEINASRALFNVRITMYFEDDTSMSLDADYYNSTYTVDKSGDIGYEHVKHFFLYTYMIGAEREHIIETILTAKELDGGIGAAFGIPVPME